MRTISNGAARKEKTILLVDGANKTEKKSFEKAKWPETPVSHPSFRLGVRFIV